MLENQFPKWIETPDSTPENPKGIVVQDAAEEKALLEKLTSPVAPAQAEAASPSEEPAIQSWKPFGKKG